MYALVLKASKCHAGYDVAHLPTTAIRYELPCADKPAGQGVIRLAPQTLLHDLEVNPKLEFIVDGCVGFGLVSDQLLVCENVVCALNNFQSRCGVLTGETIMRRSSGLRSAQKNMNLL